MTDGVGGDFGEGVLRFDDIDEEIAHWLRRELRVHTATKLAMWSTETEFPIEGWLRVLENGEELRKRDWHKGIPCDLI